MCFDVTCMVHAVHIPFLLLSHVLFTTFLAALQASVFLKFVHLKLWKIWHGKFLIHPTTNADGECSITPTLTNRVVFRKNWTFLIYAGWGICAPPLGVWWDWFASDTTVIGQCPPNRCVLMVALHFHHSVSLVPRRLVTLVCVLWGWGEGVEQFTSATSLFM